MPKSFFRKALDPLFNMLDTAATAPNHQPTALQESTRFPDFPWDLRTVIIVFPEDAPFKYLNLNTLLGFTGVPFDQSERWKSDPSDAFDLQFGLEGKDRGVTYKQYHSISKEVGYRPDDVYFKIGNRLLYEGRWPKYRIEYNQPEQNLELILQLDTWPQFQWWAYSPDIYCHYTSFCDCRLEWKWDGDNGVIDVPALHDHGWGKNLLPVRIPVKVFRYEVMRIPKEAFAISLWTEGPFGLELKNIGLLRWDKQPSQFMERYDCQVLEWEVFDNYVCVPCRVPRRWRGAQRGERGEFVYEAVRNSEPRPILGEGFLYGFDYEGELKTESHSGRIEGSGYVEQLGRFLR